MDQYYYYTYNSDGIRSGKRMEEYSETKETVTYYLDGSNIIREIRDHVDDGTTDLFYYYDENGSPIGMSYGGGTTYTYYKNIFGDILGIFDENGTLVVRYTYDAWGNIISTTGSMASTLGQDNPFRYRGYYYDTETGFYYLNARYYNPELGRFISADPVLDTSNAIGCNLFAYCGNDPINRIDPLGNSWTFWGVLAAVAVAVVTVAVVAVAAPAAICAGAAILGSYGVSAGVATATATAAVAVVGANTVISAADSTYYSITGESPVLDHVFDGDTSEYLAYHQLSAMAAGGLTELSAMGSQMGVCFVAGTLIATETGDISIERIEPGMLVYAHDPETGETTLKPVVQTFVNETSQLIHLVVDGEKIVTTPEHPFWVPNNGWTAAIHLRAGDVLQTLNGEYVVVEFVQHELLESPIKVYNFEVEGFHTYFVGECDVLVHNSCEKDRISNVSKSQSPVWKNLNRYRGNIKTSGSGRNLKYYQWDPLHNEIEMYNRLGKHIGVIDPVSGIKIKPPVPGRKLGE